MASPTIVWQHMMSEADHTPDKLAKERALVKQMCDRNDWSSVMKFAEQSMAYAVLALDVLKDYGLGWCRDVEASIDEIYE